MIRKIWMVDIAREQGPNLDHLQSYAKVALDSGFDSLGLYLEHRFEYKSSPETCGSGALNHNHIRSLQSLFPELTIIPFINVLGHMEGFLNTSKYEGFRESKSKGMQICPSHPNALEFCKKLIDDILACFTSPMIHIGGDETYELCQCERCQGYKNKASLYSHFMVPLLQHINNSGRTPAVWGDMILEFPEILAEIPRETVIFDWEYKVGCRKSSQLLRNHGHRIFGCPTIHVYDAAWCHVPETFSNVREVSRDVKELDLEGICLTTWEATMFSPYDSIFDLVKSCATIISDPDATDPKLSKWQKLIGIDLNKLGGIFQFDGHRSRLKCRFLLFGNPFLLWKHHGQELNSEIGDKALNLIELALIESESEAEKGVTLMLRSAIEFAQMAETAAKAYREGRAEAAVSALAPTRYLFDSLEKIAIHNVIRIGGSLADIERCKLAKSHVEAVILRIRNFGHSELGYLPSFDVITDLLFVPHDQACWWAINSWGDR